jgi:hypothetical protein
MTLYRKQIAANIIQLVREEIEKRPGTKLGKAIRQFLNVQKEKNRYWRKLDYVDAIQQAERICEKNGDSDLLLSARLLLIEAGRYRVMPKKEIERTSLSGDKKVKFEINGIAYTADWADFQLVAGYENEARM